MRVAVLSTFGETCGIATYSEALVAALVEHGVEPVVLAPRLRARDRPRGPQPKRLWQRDHATRLQAAATFREIQQARADLVHVQISLGLVSPPFLDALSQLCAGAGLPLLTTLHDRGGGGLLRRFAFARTLRALRQAHLLVHEQDQRDALARDRVHVIPHGIWPVSPRAAEVARRELNVDAAVPIISHFGFLHPDKGIEAVLAAVAELRVHRFPDLMYRVCGSTFPTKASRAYLARLQRQALELGLKCAVQLTGEFMSEDRATLELQAADLVVLNYRTGNHQGASGAGRRALSAGGTVAVSTAPIFDDMRSAVHTMHRPLCEEIADLLDHPGKRLEIAARGRTFCHARTWSRVAALHADLYRELTCAAGRASAR